MRQQRRAGTQTTSASVSATRCCLLLLMLSSSTSSSLSLSLPSSCLYYRPIHRYTCLPHPFISSSFSFLFPLSTHPYIDDSVLRMRQIIVQQMPSQSPTFVTSSSSPAHTTVSSHRHTACVSSNYPTARTILLSAFTATPCCDARLPPPRAP